MTKLFDGQVAELLQNAGKHNPEIQALSFAVLQEKRRIMAKVQMTRTMAMIDELPEKILDVLAVELRTPAYSEDFPIDVKRTLIKGTIAFYAKLGTPAAVNWVIHSVFGNGNMEDWYSYGGEPHHFRVTVQNDGTFSSLDGMAEFLRLVSSIKRLSSWLDEITVTTNMGEQSIRFGGVMATITRMPVPELADTIRFKGTVRTGGKMASIHSIPIPESTSSNTPSCTGQIGVRRAVTVAIPLPEIPE